MNKIYIKYYYQILISLQSRKKSKYLMDMVIYMHIYILYCQQLIVGTNKMSLVS